MTYVPETFTCFWYQNLVSVSGTYVMGIRNISDLLSETTVNTCSLDLCFLRRYALVGLGPTLFLKSTALDTK